MNTLERGHHATLNRWLGLLMADKMPAEILLCILMNTHADQDRLPNRRDIWFAARYQFLKKVGETRTAAILDRFWMDEWTQPEVVK